MTTLEVTPQMEREAFIRDLSDRKLSDKQVRLAQFLADHRYVRGELTAERDDAAVRILDGLREFNKQERENKETGQEPVKKVPTLSLARATEALEELKQDYPTEDADDAAYVAGVDDSIKTLEELAA